MENVILEACPFCWEPGLYEESFDHGYKTYSLGCSDSSCIAHLIKCDAPMHEVEESIFGWNERKEKPSTI